MLMLGRFSAVKLEGRVLAIRWEGLMLLLPNDETCNQNRDFFLDVLYPIVS